MELPLLLEGDIFHSHTRQTVSEPEIIIHTVCINTILLFVMFESTFYIQIWLEGLNTVRIATRADEWCFYYAYWSKTDSLPPRQTWHCISDTSMFGKCLMIKLDGVRKANADGLEIIMYSDLQRGGVTVPQWGPAACESKLKVRPELFLFIKKN